MAKWTDSKALQKASSLGGSVMGQIGGGKECHCCICGEKISRLDNKWPYAEEKLPDSFLCDDCNVLLELVRRGVANRSGGVRKYSGYLEALREKLVQDSPDPIVKSELLELIDQKTGGYPTYLESQQAVIKERFPEEISHNFGGRFYVNPSTKEFVVVRVNGQMSTVRNFSDLNDFNVTEDGNSVTSGRAGAAAVGALLGGAAGAIVGSSMSKKTEQMVSQLDIVLSYKGLDAPMEVISLLSESVPKGSNTYAKKVQLCNQIVSALKQIMEEGSGISERAERGARAIYAFSVADEILKFKQLMDDGVITQAEFDAQKQKLLSLDY